MSYKCSDAPSPDTERRRCCWIGILSLHTHQAMLFRDVDIKSLLETLPPQHMDDLQRSRGEVSATPIPGQPTGTMIMDIKMTLFNLAGRICNRDATVSEPSEDSLNALDAEISERREVWSAQFLQDGSASVLDPCSYSHWCMFEMYANQLYLHLHRPFSRVRSTDGPPRYRQSSKWRCITAGTALLDIQRRYVELPRLRHHRWSIFGMNATFTVHGALALASSILDASEHSWDLSSYRLAFDAAVDRIETLQHQSAIYHKAYPILRHIQYVFLSSFVMSLPKYWDRTIFTEWQNGPDLTGHLDFSVSLDNWMDTMQLFDPTSIDWVSEPTVLQESNS